MAVSLADKKRLFFEDNTGLRNKSLTDLEWEYYSTRSGLTPRGRYSIADHKRAYFESQTGLSGKSISHLEREFYVRKGISLGPISSMASDYFFSPREFGNLELALEADKLGGAGTTNPADAFAVSQWNDLSGKGRHVTQSDAAKQPKFRNANPNKIPYGNATGSDATNLGVGRGTIAIEAEQMKFTPDGTTGVNYFYTRLGVNGFPVKPGKQYTALFSARAASSTEVGSGKVEIYWYNSAGTYLSASTGVATALTTSLTQHSLTAVAPSNSVFAAVLFWVGTSLAATAIQYADFLSFAEGTSTTWVPPVVLPNNQPVVQFREDLTELSVVVGNVFSTLKNATVYVVRNIDMMPSSNTPRLVRYKAVAASSTGWAISPTNAHIGRSFYFDTVGENIAGEAGSPLFTPVLDVGKFDETGAKVSYLRDGIFKQETALGAITPFTDGIIYIGNEGAPSTALYGSIAAVYIYSGIHNDETRKRIERALGAKYGIAVA